MLEENASRGHLSSTSSDHSIDPGDKYSVFKAVSQPVVNSIAASPSMESQDRFGAFQSNDQPVIKTGLQTGGSPPFQGGVGWNRTEGGSTGEHFQKVIKVMPPALQLLKGWGHNQSKVCQILGCFYFCSDLPNFWHVNNKWIGKHFSVFFSLVFTLFSRNNICKKRWRNNRVLLSKQKASFVSPSTKEQQRKPLVVFCIGYFLKTKRKPAGKKNTEKRFPSNL